MDESDLSEGYEGREEVLDPDNLEDYFPLLEKNLNKVVTEMEQNQS